MTLLSSFVLTTFLSISVNAATKIMPLGDSITGSPASGCWRALLWQDLTDAGKTDIDFVGSLPAQECGFAYDGENEGHGGFLAVDIAQQNLLTGWLASTLPEIVIMHLGTNDVWNNVDVSSILSSFDTLIDQMRISNANMQIGVAQILPMNPFNCAECYDRAVALNAAIVDWAPTRTTVESPITVIDQWTSFDTTVDTDDGVHPNDSGNVKISANWYPYLVDLV